MSWAHSHFHPKRDGAGHHRFCRHCYASEEDCPSAHEVAQIMSEGKAPSDTWVGCCENNGSPSAMRNHTKSAHPEQLPEGVSHSRQGQAEKSDLPKQVDATLMREWSTNIVLGALQPVRLISDACVRTVICKYVQGVGGKTRLQAEVDENTTDIKVEVKEVLARAKAEGCRFVISGDTWKPKMRRRAHYLAIYINWCSAEWEHKTVCLSANPLPAPRTGEAYQQAFAAALAESGLELSDIVCSLSDHEGAIRKGLRDLGPASVGCGTHAFQLCPKHGLPPLREKNQGAPAAASDESSDSDSSSSSSSSSDSAAAAPAAAAAGAPAAAAAGAPAAAAAGAPAAAAAGAPAAAAAGAPAAAAAGAPAAAAGQRGSKKDPDHLAMQSELARPFKQFRSTVKWYVNNDDAYNAMEADCRAEELPFMAYVSETPTRWSSGLDCAVSVLHNNHGHAFSRARHSTRAPTELSPAEALEGLHLCAVLTPVKRGTKLLEGDGDKALASMYLPVWHAVSQALNPRITKELPIPKVLIAKFGEKVKVSDLKMKAKKLLLFLHNDLIKIKNKHLIGTNGEKLLRVCSYLDPRFKGHGYATQEQLQEARACLKQLAFESSDRYEHVAKQMQELAADPDNRRLIELASQPGRGRGRGRGRVGRGRGKGANAAPVAGPLQPFRRPDRNLRLQTSDERFLFGAVQPASEAELGAVVVDIQSEIERQVVLYDHFPPEPRMEYSPLAFWKKNSARMPYLAVVARHLFGIPASTSSLERLFSAAGRAVTRRRPRLSSKRASHLIFGHANVVRGVTGYPVWQKRQMAKKVHK
jgi:hypothetical protein